MNTVLNKDQSLSLSVEANSTDDVKELLPNSWVQEMDIDEERATDRILEHLIQSGARPYINVTGDIVDIVTSITNGLTQFISTDLSKPLKIMMDYIARWLCDYVEETNTSSLRVVFGFDAKIIQEDNI